MRKGLVNIAMEKGDISLTKGFRKFSYEDISKKEAFVLRNIDLTVLGKEVSVHINEDISDEYDVIMVYREGIGILARVYKRNLSAVQVLREIYQKVRGY